MELRVPEEVRQCQVQQEAVAVYRDQQGAVFAWDDPWLDPSRGRGLWEGDSCLCRGPPAVLALARSEEDGCDHEETPFLVHQLCRDPDHPDPRDRWLGFAERPSQAKDEMMAGRGHAEAGASRAVIEAGAELMSSSAVVGRLHMVIRR